MTQRQLSLLGTLRTVPLPLPGMSEAPWAGSKRLSPGCDLPGATRLRDIYHPRYRPVPIGYLSGWETRGKTPLSHLPRIIRSAYVHM